MSASLQYIALIFVIAVLLDLYIVSGLSKYRALRQEQEKAGGPINKLQLFKQAFSADRKSRWYQFLQRAQSNARLIANLAKPTKSFWPAIGIVLVFLGLKAMREENPVFAYPPLLSLADHWDNSFYLNIINLPNALIGLLAILFGAGIFVASTDLSDWKKDGSALCLPELPAIQWEHVWPQLLGGLALFGLLLLQLAYHSYSAISMVLWLISLLTLTLLFWKRERNHSIDLHPRIDWLDGIWMLLLFGLGIGIGATLLRDIPAWLIPDEGAFWETARSIAMQEYKPAFFDAGVYSFPIASSIFQAAVMRWAGINLWGWRFASVLAASLTIFPLYLLGRELFDRRVGVAACLFMIASPWYLAFARLGYNNSQALFPVVLAIYFLVIGLRRGSYFYLWLAGLASGLGYYTYFSAWLALVILVVSIAALPFTARIRFRKALPLLLAVLAGWLVMALPRIVYGLSGDLDSTLYYKVIETSFVSGFYGRAIFGKSAIDQTTIWHLGQTEAFYSLPHYGILWVRGIAHSIVALFDPIYYKEHFIVSELIGPGTSLFFVFGLSCALVYLRKIHYFILNAWFLLGLLILSILAAYPPRITHAVAIIPVIALFAALGLVIAIEAVIHEIALLQSQHRLWENIAIGLALAIIPAMGLFAYFVKVPLYYAPDFDRTASWLAWKISDPVTFVFIDEVPTNHDAQHQSQTQLTGHEVLIVNRADLQIIPEAVKGKRFLAFIGAENNGAQIVAELSNLFPEANSQRLSNPAGTTLGFVVSTLPLEVELNADLANGLRDLWGSPARYFLLASISLALVLLAFGWRKKLDTDRRKHPLAVRP